MDIRRKWKLVPSNKVKSLYGDLEEQYKNFDYQSLIYERERLEHAIEKENAFFLPA